ncbi:hypothetical protein FOC1_g10008876 [Fusarium oxysporum f. sp. cubense race 1]|uniref:Uncharacterized protein n=1 Tax=Fusarium oxysporum f. sp. cubense (strain race 1) TaxID=1229664 RepID=N4UTC6_FUSC1|nr:hypothetical protein FOC1_g10008876 [Fusarium oxysporum f. sp. cubense race 1]
MGAPRVVNVKKNDSLRQKPGLLGVRSSLRLYDRKKNFAEDLGNATCLASQDINADTSRIGPDLIQLWEGLISDYTYRKLTKSSDWLPALSGIAKWLQPHLGNPGYLAGLWNNSDLHRQLAWFSCTTQNPRPRYRAPSWSWASIDGCIIWTKQPGILTPHLEIIDISTTRGGSDPTGPVIGGHILIKGSLGRVQVIDHKTGPILCREDEINIEHSRAEDHRAGKIYPAKKLRRQLDSMSRLLIDFLLA